MGRRPSFPFCSHSANTQLHNFAWLYTENASVEVSLVFLPSKSYLIYLLEMWQDIQLEWHFERACKTPFACSKCNQSFKDSCDLKILKGSHSKEAICLFEMWKDIQLEWHIERAWKNPLACSKCDQSFTDSCDLKIMKGSTQERSHLPVRNVTRHSAGVAHWKSMKDSICLFQMWPVIYR